jgi:hypothetical protein
VTSQRIQRITQYTLSSLPESHDEWTMFSIHVVYRGTDRWSVDWMAYQWSIAANDWVVGHRPDNDHERGTTRFPLDLALALAHERLPTIRVNGWRVVDGELIPTPKGGRA